MANACCAEYMLTKYEVSSLNHSKDIEGPKISIFNDKNCIAHVWYHVIHK